MLLKFLEERRTNKLVHSMAQRLVADYGRSSEYSEGQVRTAFSKLRYKSELESLAIAVFCNEQASKNLKVDRLLVKKYKWDTQDLAVGYGASGVSGERAGDIGDTSE